MWKKTKKDCKKKQTMKIKHNLKTPNNKKFNDSHRESE